MIADYFGLRRGDQRIGQVVVLKFGSKFKEFLVEGFEIDMGEEGEKLS